MSNIDPRILDSRDRLAETQGYIDLEGWIDREEIRKEREREATGMTLLQQFAFCRDTPRPSPPLIKGLTFEAASEAIATSDEESLNSLLATVAHRADEFAQAESIESILAFVDKVILISENHPSRTTRELAADCGGALQDHYFP